MSRHLSVALFSFPVFLLAPLTSALAQERDHGIPSVAMESAMVEVRTDALKWSPLKVPPGMKGGGQVAVLHGNPLQPGPYTIRLKFPAGHSFPPHWHPMPENLTVISGKFFVAMGETEDPAALKAYNPGDFLVAPARMPHYGRVEGETIVQLHGMGPFEIYPVKQ